MGILQPCPFCGSLVSLDVKFDTDDSYAPRPHRVHFIKCYACDISMEDMSSPWFSDDYGYNPPPETIEDEHSKQHVITMWQHRWIDEAIAEELERLRAIEVKWNQLGLNSLLDDYG